MGRIGKFKMDCGAAEKAEQTLRLIADLGSEAEHCAAYSPWLKPFVERFFRTQNSQLEVCCQG
ncbi:MAG TPA: hypothetical protein VMF50_13050, partial [Candidatus Binataceae bacterium]|nr:hypothetical protein [Candidatus Binataceae bacterium]